MSPVRQHPRTINPRLSRTPAIHQHRDDDPADIWAGDGAVLNRPAVGFGGRGEIDGETRGVGGGGGVVVWGSGAEEDLELRTLVGEDRGEDMGYHVGYSEGAELAVGVERECGR